MICCNSSRLDNVLRNGTSEAATKRIVTMQRVSLKIRCLDQFSVIPNRFKRDPVSLSKRVKALNNARARKIPATINNPICNKNRISVLTVLSVTRTM